jgi:membrane protein YdbS with pleckstrin-like domain
VPISRRALADDEEVLVDVRPHWVFFLGPAILMAVAVAVAVVIAVRFPNAPVAAVVALVVIVVVPSLWLAGRMARWFGISLVVTTSRLLYRQGVLGRDLVQVRLQRIADVHCAQSLIERMIGAGRLVLEVEGDDSMVIDDVRRPRALQRVIAVQLDELSGPGSTGVGRRDASVGWDEPGRRDASGGWDEPGRRDASGGWDVSGEWDEPRRWDEAGEHPPTPVAGTGPGDPRLTPPQGTPVLGDPRPGGEPPSPGDDVDPGVVRDAVTRIADQLVVLEGLRRRGIVSDEEFAAKKAELLNRI